MLSVELRAIGEGGSGLLPRPSPIAPPSVDGQAKLGQIVLCAKRKLGVLHALPIPPKTSKSVSMPALREASGGVSRSSLLGSELKKTTSTQSNRGGGGGGGNGGEKGDRTLDLRLMSPALYQLSYLAASNAVYDTIFYPLSSSTKLNFLLYPHINQKSAALLRTSYFKIKYAGNPITPSKPSSFLKSPTFSACNLMMEYLFNSF
jgi:hypothetical protein